MTRSVFRQASRSLRSRALLGALLLPFGLAACGGDSKPTVDSTNYPMDRKDRDMAEAQKSGDGIFGKDGLILFGKKKEDVAPNGVAVNSFLWRASLDTLSFMPLASADPFGGVIITDWYSPPETPDRRFKANAYILDRDLRADGIRVTLFQQRRDGTNWADLPVESKTSTDLENAILTRARQLRVDQTSANR
ncbi:MAG TPA: DUF3576 domain-containing protein [Alphaproteobacteria bacterium]|jgi:hypothetical protein